MTQWIILLALLISSSVYAKPAKMDLTPHDEAISRRDSGNETHPALQNLLVSSNASIVMNDLQNPEIVSRIMGSYYPTKNNPWNMHPRYSHEYQEYRSS